MDPSFPQIYGNIGPPEPDKFHTTPYENESRPNDNISDIPELSPSLSSRRESSPRLSVGTGGTVNSSPTVSPLSVEDGGQRMPALSEEIERNDIPSQGEIKWRKNPKYSCSGCQENFTVKREYESHHRRCVGKPLNICPCGLGITRRHNMKTHYQSQVHRSYEDRLRALEEKSSNLISDQSVLMEGMKKNKKS
ncbi:uncharacterized protein DFL_009243 [Arthrobotrys flagrans]|uniref:C2H2-type domain-containing protein n=1 Tax=Arthrobotrys flagrans TaxID=97331 RepID=A0A436ZR30_ARTFL|nr:hypothetical protein DFL_009243 [Arthrobotrys flagrans]